MIDGAAQSSKGASSRSPKRRPTARNLRNEHISSKLHKSDAWVDKNTKESNRRHSFCVILVIRVFTSSLVIVNGVKPYDGGISHLLQRFSRSIHRYIGP